MAENPPGFVGKLEMNGLFLEIFRLSFSASPIRSFFPEHGSKQDQKSKDLEASKHHGKGKQ